MSILQSLEHLVIVTPVFEDTKASSRLFQELRIAFQQKIYIVVIDDGSVREPVKLTNIDAAGISGALITLKRNVGHQRAIAIGLNYVSEHIPEALRVIVMDSDGEDLPESIKDLIKPLESEEIDMVVAKRKSRVESLNFRMFYVVYQWLFQCLTGRIINFGNFMALKPAAVKRLVAMQELWIHIAACALLSKLRITGCSLDRGPRYAGQSKMNFVGLALHGFKAMMVFAEDVLVRTGIACAFVATLSVLGGVVSLILNAIGFTISAWIPVAIGILFIVFLLTGVLALMILMLMGMLNRGSILTTNDYKQLIDQIQYTDG